MSPSPAPMPTLADVEGWLHTLFIGDAAAGLRKEDRQKARELVPLLAELARLCRRPTGVLVDACAGKSPLGLVAAATVLPAGWTVRVLERDPDRLAAARLAGERLAASGAQTSVVLVETELRLEGHGASTSSGAKGDDDRHDGDDASAESAVRHDRERWTSAFAGVDVVCGLHACGPASDAIIDAAVAAQVKHLLLVPCCYGAHPSKPARGIPGQLVSAGLVDVAPRQGVVGRRLAQAVVDAERTLRLERGGYDVDVVEFVGATVTPHNLLFRGRRGLDAVRRGEAERRWQGLAARMGPTGDD